MATSKRRFAEYNEEERQCIVDEKDSKNTKTVIKQSIGVLTTYAHARGFTLGQIEQFSSSDLAEFLRKMWPELRKVDGDYYYKKSLGTIRYGIQRHFAKLKGIDIVSDPEFAASTEMFRSVIVKLKQEGKGAVKHKEVITRKDMEKLYKYFDAHLNSPKVLQSKVFVDVMLYFCNRGRENLRLFSSKDFNFGKDSKGHEYVYTVKDRKTKNHQDDDDHSAGGVMYALPGNPRCPVASFRKYVSKLNPLCDAFWQRPRPDSKVSDTSLVWYENVPVGKNYIGSKMKSMSSEAGLSRVYTNHCLRATCVTTLDKQGLEARHIMKVSGHKSETSIRSYSDLVDENKKKEMSLALSSATVGSSSHIKKTGVSIDHSDQENDNVTLTSPKMSPRLDELITNSQESALQNLLNSPSMARLLNDPGNVAVEESEPVIGPRPHVRQQNDLAISSRNTVFNVQNSVVNVHYH